MTDYTTKDYMPENRTTEFPMNAKRGVWFFILYYENGIKEEAFTTAYSQKASLLNFIKELEKKKIEFKLYGVWTGHYNTHIFRLDIDLIKKELPK